MVVLPKVGCSTGKCTPLGVASQKQQQRQGAAAYAPQGACMGTNMKVEKRGSGPTMMKYGVILSAPSIYRKYMDEYVNVYVYICLS